MADSGRIFCGMSRFGEIKDRLKQVVESDREDVAYRPDEDVAGNEASSPSERFNRNLALIRAYETRDNESPPQAPQRP
jgi:hypothetical protein